jgi:predicted Fe-Mo cluster-binding NifX family protein
MYDRRTVAIACETADGLAGNVSGHFIHTPYFVVAELDGKAILSTRLEASPGHEQGGTMPGFVDSLGVSEVIVGGIGAGAVNGLRTRGIEVTAGATGSAANALIEFASGTLPRLKPWCVQHEDSSQGCGHESPTGPPSGRSR